MIISFPILGKFSTIISSILSWPFFLSSCFGTPMIRMLRCLTLSWRSQIVLISLICFSFFLSDSFIYTILSCTSLIPSSASDQFSSVPQSCPTLRDPMKRSTPGLPVHHHLPEFTQTHIHRVSDAIQPSHPQSSPSPPAPNPSQHQSLFQ